jgi:hypothetical protein
MAELNDLSVTDASNTARFPEGQSPASLNNAARALEGIIARANKDANWASLLLAILDHATSLYSTLLRDRRAALTAWPSA